jgi:N utilization substance protein B
VKQRESVAAQRRQTREHIVKVLYEMDIGGLETGAARKRVISHCRNPGLRRFACILMDATLEHMADLDRIILSVAENWHLSRMAAIDRNILRLGAAEILYVDEVPEKVAINEAIEIAKMYSTENSGGFVNGILDKVARMKSEIRDNL